MATVSIRHLVDDVDAAIAFYCQSLGFQEQMHPAPAFAMLTRGDLRLLLSAAGGAGPGGGSQAMPDGRVPEPGGWNRFTLEVDDLEATVDALRGGGAHFRNDIVTGIGGKQILVEDPSGNVVELFEPTRSEARLDVKHADAEQVSYQIRPIGYIESSLTDAAEAPNQGEQGAPDAWLVLDAAVHEGARDLTIGSEVVVLTWLHQARRDELVARPGSDPVAPERGVFSTRSPDRPNPVGIHRVAVLAVDGNRLRIGPIEAIHGTPVLDLRPVRQRDER
jgi:tRNA-Thr(GGU) m(6)t(6)A37 methyltransferase TsaA